MPLKHSYGFPTLYSISIFLLVDISKEKSQITYDSGDEENFELHLWVCT